MVMVVVESSLPSSAAPLRFLSSLIHEPLMVPLATDM